MEHPTPQELREFLDKQALAELLRRYSRAVDRCDAELLMSCYHPDALDEHGAFRGAPAAFLEHLRRSLFKPDVGPLQHAISNELFEVRGYVAHGESYFHTRFITPEGKLETSVGRYVDRFERRNGEWRIAHRQVILEYARPGYSTANFIPGRRDRTDPSYRR